jgi:cytochrome c oxidase accessory protein FixG
VFIVLIAVYASLPFVKVGGHPAVFLDVEHREFFLFGQVYNAQDIWMTVFLVTGAAFGLVVLTATLGRVWCGWACPQTVFLDGVYRRIERLIEGPREKRMRRDQGPLTFDKAWRKALVHTAYVLVSFVLAHMFLAYFVSIPRLLSHMRHRPGEHPELFLLVMVFAGILHFNFVWFREQFCVVLCPYGRLQSVLLDPDSAIIGYDHLRGEPRGKASSKERGACVDCGRCVAVCPTGIDIRHGLQMDCIACTACIDACDEIMDKLQQPRGLVRYDSQRGLAGEPRRFLRPRLFAYAALGALGLVVATTQLRGRKDVEANMLRVTGAPYIVESGNVRNALHLHVVNKRTETTTFEITKAGADAATYLVAQPVITLKPLGSMDVPIFVSLAEGAYHGEFELSVRVRPQRGGTERIVKAPFLGPSR